MAPIIHKSTASSQHCRRGCADWSNSLCRLPLTTISLRAILSTEFCGVVRKKRVQRPLQADALKNRTHARVGYFFAVIRVFSINLSLLHCCGKASAFI
jgi:hypothetical protein